MASAGSDQTLQDHASAEAEVQVIEIWFSPYAMRVKLALAAKGIPFSSIPQALGPKSPLLLQSNPVHKKVPVLLHRGKPICESLVICEYIDEAFISVHQLLPKDPYLKAMARFWADFGDKKVIDFLLKLLREPKQNYEGIVHDIKEHLQTLEERAFPPQLEHPFFGGMEANYVDVVLGPLLILLPTMQNLLTQNHDKDVFEVKKLPRLQAWFKAFGDLPFVRTTLPAPAEVLEAVKELRKILVPNEL